MSDRLLDMGYSVALAKGKQVNRQGHRLGVPTAIVSFRGTGRLVLALALSLLVPSFARAQDSVRNTIVRTIVRLEPSAFPSLPVAVRRALTKRDCVIPQTGWQRMDPRPHNVARGRFTSPRRHDWAVLCSRRDRDESYMIILHGRTGILMDSLAFQRLSDYMLQLGTNWIFVREISTVTPARIRGVAEPHADRLPRCLDHDGVKDSFADDAATFWYRLQGRWLDLEIGGMDAANWRRTMYARPCDRRGDANQ